VGVQSGLILHPLGSSPPANNDAALKLGSGG